MLGPNAKIGPNDDADGDGISNMNEYLAGTYAFIPDDGFRLSLIRNASSPPLLEFMVVNSRSYIVHNSTDLQTWIPIRFNVPAEAPFSTNLFIYQATDTHMLRVEPILSAGSTAPGQFFKVQVQ